MLRARKTGQRWACGPACTPSTQLAPEALTVFVWESCTILAADQTLSHSLEQVGSGQARAYGMTGTLAAGSDTAIIVLWIQNVNNTFAQQNASLPAAQRPQLNEITQLILELGT